uniref:Uncharacterized protein n=1 Tax=viral metagenome TaxID=1070528 RepID=A0A6C0D6W8_9ZZZZ
MNNDWLNTAVFTDPIDDFRNNFYKKLEEEKKQKEIELKRVQKNCMHKYTIIVPYNNDYSIASCVRCNHAKFAKN